MADPDAPKMPIPPEIDLKEQFEKEANDPSMIAYLKSLGIDPNYVPPKDDPRRVVVSSLSVKFKDHETPVVLKFDTDEDLKQAKKTPMVIKEGCEYRMTITFRVQHTVVLGLKIQNQISKLGKTIVKDEEILGSYPPKNEFQSLDIPKNEWNVAPTGTLSRGEYKAKMKFLDDDGNCHLEFDYIIKIAKDYSG